jgi:hypothetical protein
MVDEKKKVYNSPDPLFLTDKAKMLNDKFYLELNETVKSYPISKATPDGIAIYNRSETNKEMHEANMVKMLNLQNEYFIYKNDVIQSNETIQKEINEIDKELNGLEAQNKVLSTQLDSLKGSSYSAEGLFDDAQITRNQLFFSNIVLFGTIAGLGYMFYKSIKNAN